ncbi:MAG: hypothetical protein KJN99_05615, partial [Marinicaulis sp.]|nr:hypothetical protein [Marinicaulis sp.]
MVKRRLSVKTGQRSIFFNLKRCTIFICAIFIAFNLPSARAGDDGWAGSIYDAFDKIDDLNFEFSTGIEYD